MADVLAGSFDANIIRRKINPARHYRKQALLITSFSPLPRNTAHSPGKQLPQMPFRENCVCLCVAQVRARMRAMCIICYLGVELIVCQAIGGTVEAASGSALIRSGRKWGGIRGSFVCSTSRNAYKLVRTFKR